MICKYFANSSSIAVSYSILIRQQCYFLYNYNIEGFIMMKNLVVFGLFLLATQAVIRDDIVTRVPGYGDDFQTHVYSGYLNTTDPSRRLHYVFVQSAKGANNSDPLTLWLNGGPGCSSLLGFLQQIGPYYMEEGKNYTVGDKLVPNPYSWHNVSNLLFLQSPAGVGYSINTNASFSYNDLTTMRDNFDAIRFFFTYYPEYKKNAFWIAGESYAGKYVPDLAYRIDHFNLDPTTKADQKIKLRGIFIGNGVIDFRQNSLLKSQVDYYLKHDFIDPETISYWEGSCSHDWESAGCQFFNSRFEQTLDDINPYNVYSYCYYNDSFLHNQDQNKRQFLSQQSILMSISKQNALEEQENKNNKKGSMFNGAPCAYFDGLYQYFNAHFKQYHAEARQSEKVKWNGPCAQDISNKYVIDQSGSVFQLSYLLNRLDDIHLVLYNGDWDSVVPFEDTYKNLQNLKVHDPSLFAPIFFQDQHIGFNTILSGLNFIIVKGASHMVPQSKRPQTLYLYRTLLESFPGQPLKFN